MTMTVMMWACLTWTWNISTAKHLLKLPHTSSYDLYRKDKTPLCCVLVPNTRSNKCSLMLRSHTQVTQRSDIGHRTTGQADLTGLWQERASRTGTHWKHFLSSPKIRRFPVKENSMQSFQEKVRLGFLQCWVSRESQTWMCLKNCGTKYRKQTIYFILYI